MSAFEKKQFYQPMQGNRVHKVPIRSDRSSSRCRFCEALALVGPHKEQIGHCAFRCKNLAKVMAEIKFRVEKCGLEYICFNAETFLAMSERARGVYPGLGYPNVQLSFWRQTRIETISDDRIREVERVNCIPMSIGLEHGNKGF